MHTRMHAEREVLVPGIVRMSIRRHTEAATNLDNHGWYDHVNHNFHTALHTLAQPSAEALPLCQSLSGIALALLNMLATLRQILTLDIIKEGRALN